MIVYFIFMYMATLIISKGKEVGKECGQNHSIVLFRERKREKERGRGRGRGNEREWQHMEK